MNKTTVKRLEEIAETIKGLKNELESIGEEEQEAYDNMPESLQDSEKGQTMYENIDTLETAASDLDDIITNYNNYQKAQGNGMTEKEAELVTELCQLRHQAHSNMNSGTENMTMYGVCDSTTKESETFFTLTLAKKWMRERMKLGHEVSGSKTKSYSNSDWYHAVPSISMDPTKYSLQIRG